MVRLNLVAMLRRRGMTRYALAKATGLSLTTVYRLARPDGTFRRLEAATIDALCAALDCGPGELLTRPDCGSAPRKPGRK